MKKGLLLINLGTPKGPDRHSVRRFLAEFLADARVIQLPTFLRYLLLYGFILPLRPRKSARAYQAIWTDEGSPLLVISHKLHKKLQKKLSDYTVCIGMRYGEPSIKQALDELSECEHITILPLYPQYSSAATGSTLEKVLQLISSKKTIPSLRIIRDFHQDPGYINAQTERIKPFVSSHDFILFSYHGIPENHILINDCKRLCINSCNFESTLNQSCYRAQCLRTSFALANHLGLNNQQFSTSFQSRLGRTVWIKPYTDKVLVHLAKRGVKKLAISCPSFTADCLETLEEIGLRAKKYWLELGGTELSLIPSLNDNDSWVDAICTLIQSSDAP